MKALIAAPEDEKGSCRGCEFENTRECPEFGNTGFSDCGTEKVIYKIIEIEETENK
jgi:hypothetical protein